jgi:hypothetical protein
MILNRIVDGRLHNCRSGPLYKLMKNIKVRYFAFVSLLSNVFTTARIEKKTLYSLNHSILLSLTLFAVKKSNTHVEIDVE